MHQQLHVLSLWLHVRADQNCNKNQRHQSGFRHTHVDHWSEKSVMSFVLPWADQLEKKNMCLKSTRQTDSVVFVLGNLHWMIKEINLCHSVWLWTCWQLRKSQFGNANHPHAAVSEKRKCRSQLSKLMVFRCFCSLLCALLFWDCLIATMWLCGQCKDVSEVIVSLHSKQSCMCWLSS